MFKGCLLSIQCMCTGRLFQADGAETEKDREKWVQPSMAWKIDSRHKYEAQKFNADLRPGPLTLPGPWTLMPFTPSRRHCD